MATIDGKEVKVGTILQTYDGNTKLYHMARVQRVTATQAVAARLTEDMEPWAHGTHLRLKLDTPNKWGGFVKGGLEIGTGDGWYSVYWHVCEDAVALVGKMKKAEADLRAAMDERDREQQEQIKAQALLMRSGYDARTCLNEALNVWTLTFDQPGTGTVVVIWTQKERERFDYRTGHRGNVTCVEVVWFSKDRYGEVGRITTSTEGPDELKALATVRYH